MANYELKQIPPVQGTDLSVESIRLGPTGPSLGYYNTGSISTDFTFTNVTGGSLGTGSNTGTINLTAIGNQYFLDVPQFTGAVGVSGSFLISNVAIPAAFRPTTRQFHSSVMISNASSYDDAICSIETDGKIRFFNRNNIFPGLIGNCEIESQVIPYHL